LFNLADYEPVEVRLEKFIKDYPAFRISTELEVVEATRYIVKAYLFKDAQDSLAWATGYAEETVTSRGVNQTSALENCETSAIGRALANAGYAPKGKRPSREEMSKVVAKKPEKPSVAEIIGQVKLEDALRKADAEPAEQDYWTTPVGQYNKVVDAPVTLDKAMQTVTAIMGTPEAVEAPSCEHGHMQWKEGEKNGKAWGGYFCNSAISSAHRCPTKWYNLGSDGKFAPQKAWA
jgi:hypothetical protein